MKDRRKSQSVHFAFIFLSFTNLLIKTYVNEWLEEECALCFYLATADAKLPTLPIISEGNQEIQSCQFIF